MKEMMKKYFYLLAVVCATGFFTACSDDDDDDTPKYETITFEGTAWNALIDNAQFGGKMLYGESGSFLNVMPMAMVIAPRLLLLPKSLWYLKVSRLMVQLLQVL